MFTYLRKSNPPHIGSIHVLSDSDETRIGRDLECDVVLEDPLSSRVHAIVHQQEELWWVRDVESRNGTYLNGNKIDEARLIKGCTIRIGTAEYEFKESLIHPTELARRVSLTQTIVRDEPIDPDDTGSFAVGLLQDHEHGQDLLMLYQLSMRLLALNDPDEVVQISLELLLSSTNASVIGFLWISDDGGKLIPQKVIPEDSAGKVALSETLTELVLEKGRAVWVDNQSAQGGTASLSHYADALCVPLIRDNQTLGAVHVYLEHGRFRQSDFEISRSVSAMLAIALVRARQQATLQTDHTRLVHKLAAFDELLGDSAPMKELKTKIERIGRASGCVLVRGESGAGKELVARAIHRVSARADRPMLTVNCAAIPRDLMESQLFGHRRGAFTGADSDHVGWFQQADAGTLFLDEVGEMTLDGQAKLLRILEGHPFLPVGASKEVTVDVRVIAATNRDLQEFVPDGKFREDLYYRLSVFELYIPPLRDRGPDVALLLDFFLDHFKVHHGRPQLGITAAARKKLLDYQWPGNVRQLRNVVDSAVVLSGDTIEEGDLGLRDVSASGELESLRMDQWERKLIKEALKRTGGNVPEAAKLLGIGRATLYRKIDDYGIER